MDNILDNLRSLLPHGSHVYGVQIRITDSGNRLIKLLVPACDGIFDISLRVGRFLGTKVDDHVGAVWTTDCSNLVSTLGIRLYPDDANNHSVLHYVSL